MAQKIKQDASIGKNIQALRKRKGLTQEETVAQLQVMGCTISRSAYSQIEGGTYNIRVTELAALKQIFSAEYSDFFAGY